MFCSYVMPMIKNVCIVSLDIHMWMNDICIIDNPTHTYRRHNDWSNTDRTTSQNNIIYALWFLKTSFHQIWIFKPNDIDVLHPPVHLDRILKKMLIEYISNDESIHNIDIKCSYLMPMLNNVCIVALDTICEWMIFV